MSSSTTVFAYVFIIISPSFALSDGPPNGWSPPPPPADNPSPGVPLPSKWVAELFYRALANFTVNEDAATAECRRQTRMYVSQLRNNTYWAVKMSDSWSRYPNGLLAGTTHQMGVYNECVDVHQPVQGKYCMTAVKLHAVAGSKFELTKRDEPEGHDHAWNEILGFIDYGDRYRRNEMKIGICIPETCTAESLEISLQKELDSVFLPHQVQPRVNVEPILCSTDTNLRPYDNGYYVTIIIMYIIFLICCLSSLFHLVVITRNRVKEKESTVPEYVCWFSIIHNGRNLIKYDKNNDLNIFNGLKAGPMVMLLFAHKYIFYASQPVSYPKRAETLYEIGPDMFLSSMNLVDPFFYITGFLIYVMIKPQFIKRGASWIQIPMIFVYKYLRLLPAYGFMMLLTTYFIPYLHTGPLWASRMWPESDKCKNYWWANFLAISNFIEFDNQCLIVGWYMSCILQFLAIGTFIIYVCVKSRKLGVWMISIFLCLSLVIPFVLTYVTRSYGLVRVLIPFLENPSSSYEFRNLYRPFYMRGIPFYAGLLAGILVEEIQKREFKISQTVIYFWTVIITATSYWVQNYSSVFYERHRPYNAIEQATYATLSHCTWTALFFWITICHFTTGYGPIEKVLNNRFVTVLGRLTYAVYLVNIPVMMTIVSRQTTSISPTFDQWVDIWFVGVVRTYLTALILYLFVEAPFNIIIKNIFFGSKNDTKKEENDYQERKNAKLGVSNESRL